ncbi:MAG: hypothetical protein WEA99_07850 [Brumimicrobium sp.]
MEKNAKSLIVVLLCGALFSCNNSESDSNNDEQKKKTGIVEMDTTDVFSSDDYEFVLPRPFALAASFEEAGMSYDASRMNPLSNVDNYKTEGKEILNFGVYSTDLVYNIMNDQPQKSMKYFEALKELADKIGMGRIFTEDELAIRVEKNIASRDKMEDLLIDVHEKSQEYLQNNQLRYLSVIQFAGAWIEGMYLASFDFEEKGSDVVGYKIVDHMTLLNNTIKGIQAYDDRDEDLQSVLDALIDLQSTYKSLKSVKNAEGMPKLSDEDIEIIKEKIHSIRALIIS